MMIDGDLRYVVRWPGNGTPRALFVDYHDAAAFAKSVGDPFAVRDLANPANEDLYQQVAGITPIAR